MFAGLAVDGTALSIDDDANEVAEVWCIIMAEKKHPIALALTRQAVPTYDRTKYAPASGLRQGAYILSDCDRQPDIILIGTGSELQWCGEKLKAEGVMARIVSMPSFELFEQQPREYREKVLPPAVRKRLACEAGATLGWYKYVGLEGAVVGRDGFGASAPVKDVMKHFGFTTENVYNAAKTLLGR